MGTLALIERIFFLWARNHLAWASSSSKHKSNDWDEILSNQHAIGANKKHSRTSRLSFTKPKLGSSSTKGELLFLHANGRVMENVDPISGLLVIWYWATVCFGHQFHVAQTNAKPFTRGERCPWARGRIVETRSSFWCDAIPLSATEIAIAGMLFWMKTRVLEEVTQVVLEMVMWILGCFSTYFNALSSQVIENVGKMEPIAFHHELIGCYR